MAAAPKRRGEAVQVKWFTVSTVLNAACFGIGVYDLTQGEWVWGGVLIAVTALCLWLDLARRGSVTGEHGVKFDLGEDESVDLTLAHTGQPGAATLAVVPPGGGETPLGEAASFEEWKARHKALNPQCFLCDLEDQ